MMEKRIYMRKKKKRETFVENKEGIYIDSVI